MKNLLSLSILIVRNKRISSQASSDSTMSQADAALCIQKAYRGYAVRKNYGPLMNSKTGKVDAATANFIVSYARKWRAKTIFQVLLQYRAARYQDLVNFSQQVHFFNQRLIAAVNAVSACVLVSRIDPKQFQKEMLGIIKPAVLKIPYRYDLLPFFDTTYLCDPTQRGYAGNDSDEECWDAPLRRRKTTSADIAKTSYDTRYGCDDEYLVNEPFVRGPGSTIRRIAPRKHSEGAVGGYNYVAGGGPQVYSPTPYARTTVNDIRTRFNDSNLDFDPEPVKAGVYKKKPAPAPPVMNYSHLRKGPAPQAPKRDWEPKAKSEFSYETPKVDPIREMKMIGKISNEEVGALNHAKSMLKAYNFLIKYNLLGSSRCTTL